MSEEFWFRYNDATSWFDNEPDYQLDRFPVLRKTPRGVWLSNYGEEKFCLNDSRRRFAYPTVELAFDSYQHRKAKQQFYLERDLTKVTKMLARMKREGAKTENGFISFNLDPALFVWA